MRVVTGLNRPYGIAVNSQGGIIVSEYSGHGVSIFNVGGEKVWTFKTLDNGPGPKVIVEEPRGVAIDGVDNIYVCDCYALLKFTISGKLIKVVGEMGSKEGQFNEPSGVTLYNNQVYVCDRNNHRIQVFDLDLNFIGSIGSHGEGRGEFDEPRDVKFDTAGNMYVAEWGNARVQVMDNSSRFIRGIGQEKLCKPSALHIVDKYVYISDQSDHSVLVYTTSGLFVTSFGRILELNCPRCITSCVDGFIYVCNSGNGQIIIF